jgi:biotin carboxyl carrier protein
MKYRSIVNGQAFEVELGADGTITVNGQVRTVDFRNISESLYSALIDNQSVEALVEFRDGVYQILMLGDQYEVDVQDERQQRLLSASSGFAEHQGEVTVRSPMPGLIVEVRVAEGQQVEKGASLVVLESMKMENDIKAPKAGTVSKITVRKGDSVEQNKPLLTLG